MPATSATRHFYVHSELPTASSLADDILMDISQSILKQVDRVDRAWHMLEDYCVPDPAMEVNGAQLNGATLFGKLGRAIFNEVTFERNVQV